MPELTGSTYFPHRMPNWPTSPGRSGFWPAALAGAGSG